MPDRFSPEERGKVVRAWEPEPLRELTADVPLPYRIDGVTDAQVAVGLNVGQVVLIAPDGTVANEYGSAIFKLVRADA